jgi:stearoyl-CoA desaturase (Delta-9 desaturase)
VAVYQPRGYFCINRAKYLPGPSPEPSFGGGPRFEAPEVLSVSANIDLDHDDIMYPDVMYPDVVPFLAIHVGCIAAIWSGVTWQAIAICVVLYWLRMFVITAGYHRYFSHRAYSTSRVFQFILAFLAQSTAQKSVLWWAAKHRHHHLHSDTEHDVHLKKVSQGA